MTASYPPRLRLDRSGVCRVWATIAMAAFLPACLTIGIGPDTATRTVVLSTTTVETGDWERAATRDTESPNVEVRPTTDGLHIRAWETRSCAEVRTVEMVNVVEYQHHYASGRTGSPMTLALGELIVLGGIPAALGGGLLLSHELSRAGGNDVTLYAGYALAGLGAFWAVSGIIDTIAMADSTATERVATTPRLRKTPCGNFPMARADVVLRALVARTNDEGHAFLSNEVLVRLGAELDISGSKPRVNGRIAKLQLDESNTTSTAKTKEISERLASQREALQAKLRELAVGKRKAAEEANSLVDAEACARIGARPGNGGTAFVLGKGASLRSDPTAEAATQERLPTGKTVELLCLSNSAAVVSLSTGYSREQGVDIPNGVRLFFIMRSALETRTERANRLIGEARSQVKTGDVAAARVISAQVEDLLTPNDKNLGSALEALRAFIQEARSADVVDEVEGAIKIADIARATKVLAWAVDDEALTEAHAHRLTRRIVRLALRTGLVDAARGALLAHPLPDRVFQQLADEIESATLVKAQPV